MPAHEKPPLTPKGRLGPPGQREQTPALQDRNSSPPQAVIFDMDGVIVDSESRHEQAALEVVRELGFTDMHELRFKDFVGRSDREMWREFIARHNPPHRVEELLARKRRHMVAILHRDRPLFRGLPELLRTLARRYPLALASGSERPIVEAVLSLDGLDRFFSAVVTDSEMARGKPAPDIFLRAAELLALPPESCWVVEDSKPGIAAGLAAGMTVIAITNTHPAHELKDATYVVRTYHELKRLLLVGDGVRSL